MNKYFLNRLWWIAMFALFVLIGIALVLRVYYPVGGAVAPRGAVFMIMGYLC